MVTISELASRRVSRRDAIRGAGLTLVSLGAVPVLQGCGGGGPQESDDGILTIEMNDQLRFVPDSFTIRAGQTVTWRTVGTMVHTTTCDPAIAQRPEHAVRPDRAEPWDSGLIRKGESWSRRFDVPGEYVYFCIPHESVGMIGSLTIEA